MFFLICFLFFALNWLRVQIWFLYLKSSICFTRSWSIVWTHLQKSNIYFYVLYHQTIMLLFEEKGFWKFLKTQFNPPSCDICVYKLFLGARRRERYKGSLGKKEVEESLQEKYGSGYINSFYCLGQDNPQYGLGLKPSLKH